MQLDHEKIFTQIGKERIPPMNHEDRYHTTSWDGQQVQRQNPQPHQGQKSADNQRPAAAPKSSSKKKKRAGRIINPILTALLSIILWVVIVVGASVILAGQGWKWANDLCALNKTYLEATVEIPEEWIVGTEQITDDDGDVTEYTVYDIEKVANELKEKGLIDYPWLFKLFNVVYHGERKVVQGTYTLNTDMDYMALIRGMKGVKGGAAVTVDISIPEGYSVQQIIALLAENGVASVEDLTDAAANYVFDDYAFVDNENLGSITRLEGYLYPDTYNFYVGGKATTALNSMLSNFNNRIYANAELSDAFDAAAAAGYDMEDIITIASLIEKETDGSDRANISSVIYNRLENAGETAYFLQIDAALVYAAGREITQTDYTGLNSPYNLYQHTGLPPTPIANPGLASIRAALYPADTNYYFYALGTDGKHIFNETLAGHNKTLASLG